MYLTLTCHADDDCILLGKDFLELTLAIMESRPEYGIIINNHYMWEKEWKHLVPNPNVFNHRFRLGDLPHSGITETGIKPCFAGNAAMCNQIIKKRAIRWVAFKTFSWIFTLDLDSALVSQKNETSEGVKPLEIYNKYQNEWSDIGLSPSLVDGTARESFGDFNLAHLLGVAHRGHHVGA